MTPKPLDPSEGPTAWIEITNNGMVNLIEGTDPTEPAQVVVLNLRELRRAARLAEMEAAGYRTDYGPHLPP